MNHPKWNASTLHQFVNHSYWENPEDAIGDIRKWITIHKPEHRHFPECPVAIAVEDYLGVDAVCEAECTCPRNQFPAY